MHWTRLSRTQRRTRSRSTTATARSRQLSAYERTHPGTEHGLDAHSDMDLAGNPPGFGPSIRDVEDLTILSGLPRLDPDSESDSDLESSTDRDRDRD